MTFEVGEVINYIIDGFLNAPIVNSIAKNPIYTALVVTLMVVVLILIIFRDIEADETVLTMSLRTGFWVFLMLIGVLMIHNRVLAAETGQHQKNGAYDSVFTPSAASKLESDYMPVQTSMRSVSMGAGSGMSSGMGAGMGASSMNTNY